MQEEPTIPRPGELSASFGDAASDQWYACGAPPAARQGWKLYISASPLNFRDILLAVSGILEAHRAHFKYVRDIRLLRKLNAGTFGYPQIGKCIVVYMPEQDPALIAALKEALRPFRDRCPAVPYARHFGEDLPLYYRYGAYVDELVTVDGKVQRDDRYDSPVPDGVEDELARFTVPGPVDPRVRAFLLRYPVIEAIVQQGKSGIFRALNIESETFQEVILKVGYRNGQIQQSGEDGLDFLRRELRFYRQIERGGGSRDVPALVDAFESDRHAMIVLERIEGQSLLRRLLSGELRTADLDECFRIIQDLHRRSLYLGDAKIANFMGDADTRVVVLDFEGAGVLGREPMRAIRTFDLHNPSVNDPLRFDRLHFLASILFPYSEGRYDHEDRSVDLSKYASRVPANEIEAWALSRLRSELSVPVEEAS